MVALRRARRVRRIGDVVWGDLAYRVYTTALACLVLTVFASGLVGDRKVAASTVAAVSAHGPAWAGLAAAVMALIGARSGSRSGPLALEVQDVHRLLMAPLDRSRVLMTPAVSMLGYSIAAGALLGALVGGLFEQRLPGSPTEWILVGTLFGAATTALAFGVAFVTASRRVPRRLPEVVLWLLLAWSIADVAGRGVAAPFSSFGQMLIWPLRFTPWPLLWTVGAIALVAYGITAIGGLSIEGAMRRTTLVGQLRFAVTQQDLRSVLVLRRQLASERSRRRTWLPRIPNVIADRLPVFTRDIQSTARWPLVRIIRVLLLCVAAGLALRGVWSGTTPLVLAAGLATFIAALDAVEPLAQEIDHPMMLNSYPIPEGVVLLKHLAAPIVVLTGAGLVGLFAAWAVDPTTLVLQLGPILVVSAAAAAVAGAAVSVVSEAAVDTGSDAIMPPEVAGPRVVIRTLWPPMVSIIGTLPLLLAQRAMRLGQDPLPPAIRSTIAVLGLVALVFTWVRYRTDMHRSMSAAMRGETQ